MRATRLIRVLAALRLAAPIRVLAIRIRSGRILTPRTTGGRRHCRTTLTLVLTLVDDFREGIRATASPQLCASCLAWVLTGLGLYIGLDISHGQHIEAAVELLDRQLVAD